MKEEMEIKKKHSLSLDVAGEMRKNYDLVQDVIDKLQQDYRVDKIVDDDGNEIGQKTHVHPQLLNWVKEARMFTGDMWKMGGGELEQEAEKMRLDLEAKVILKMVGKSKREIQEAMKEWKKNVSFKEED